MNFANKFKKYQLTERKNGAWLDYVNSKMKKPVRDENID